jgi:preprotein translocase subunit SecG
MTILLIVVHVFACIVLITLVLIQRGRGAGLVESFSGVESMFGTKTSVFLTRTTTIMSIVFFLTCLGLAVLSVRQSKSLMRNLSGPAGKVEADKGQTPQEAGTAAQPETAKPVVPAQLPAAADVLDAAQAQ